MNIIVLLLLSLNFIHLLNGYLSLNTPTVLLPWYSNSTGAVTYELRAKPETACLQWKPRNDDVVAILKKTSGGITSYLGDTSKCSNSILLSPILVKPIRRSTIIMVKNSVDTYLRCDVIVDKIKRIEIVTRTRELNVGEMFENIEIVGYDNHDNVFNTLVGLSFQWSIKPSPNSSIKNINSIMKITNFDQTSYTADPKINELETKGLHGSSIMIEPINTGEVILTATFKDPSYETTISDSVVILVRGDIFIGDSVDDQNDIYALINTLVDIKPRRFFRGKFMPITIPSTQYLVNISNSEVVHLEHNKIRTVKLGESVVSVIDNYIPHGKHSFIPSVIFHVVNPNIIDVRLKNCDAGESCWYFASKSVVNFDVFLFYNTKQLQLDENIVLITEVETSDSKIAKLAHLHKNGSSFSLDALVKGQTEMKITLKGYINDKRVTTTFAKPLQFFKSFFVVDPITITHHDSETVTKEIYLTELPKPYNQPITLHLKAHGGTEQYQWKLHNSTTPHSKVISISTHEPGKIIVNPIVGIYTVLISDTVASYASGISTILSLIIQPIDHFEFSKSQYEVYTNETLLAGINIYIKHPMSKQYHSVYRYALLPFVFHTDLMRQSIFLYKDSTQKLSNAAQLILSEHGDYQLHASIKLTDRPLLKASSLVRAYNHLSIVVDKGCEQFNALPGSDITITTSGGPFPAHGTENVFFTNVELVNVSETANIFTQKFPLLNYGNLKSENDLFTLTLSCAKVGINKLRISLGNKPTKSNPNPFVESVIVTDVECVHPVDYDLSSLSSPIVGYENISTSRHCANVNHLRFDEDFVMKLQLVHRVKNAPVCSFPKLTDAKVHLRQIGGKATISTFSIKRIDKDDDVYQKDSFGYFTISNIDKFIGTSALDLQLDYSYHSYKNVYKKELFVNFVSLPQFTVDSVHLLQHSDDVAIVPIVGGSNIFKSVVSDSYIASILIEASSKFKDQLKFQQISDVLTINKVAVIKSRMMKNGQTTVLLVDECLPQPLHKENTSNNSTLIVNVDVIQQLLVNYTSKVMIGGSSLIEITILDSNLRPIPKDKFHLIDFSYEISSEAFINIETASSLWPDTDITRYWLIRPLAVGTTTLIIKATMNSIPKQNIHFLKSISSTVVIETYDPLRVSPDIIYAIPHMTFQLNLRGGPAVSSDHRIEYHFDNENIHNIIDFSDQLHSIYTKNEGEVSLTLKSVSMSTNQVLSQAVVKVYCSKLESVHIESSSQVVLQNNTVVVKAKFQNTNGQFTTFGILPHSIAIHWDVPNPNEIVSSYWLSGFDSVGDGSECINLQLNELGRFSLQLKVFIAPEYLKFTNSDVGSKLSLNLHSKPQNNAHYLFAKHDFETVPRLSIEPSKSLQNGWFNWKNHDQNMISSLALMADYSSLEYMIPVDGAVYIINSNYNNLWLSSDASSAATHTNTNIDSVLHWTIVDSKPSNLIQINCQDNGGTRVIDSTGQSIQCYNRNLQIKSSHVNGEAIIIANRRFQSRPIMVKVKSVNQISLIFISELKAAKVVVENKRWFAFPVGYTAKFKLVAMDEHGNIFSVVKGKSYNTECVNCKNILLKNTLDDDGSLSVIMKYPGNVAIKVSHIDEPRINFVLRFIIIHGLDLSQSSRSFVGKFELSGSSKYPNKEQQIQFESQTDHVTFTANDGTDDMEEDESSTTVFHEITIQRPLGMIFLLSPVFTIDNHQLEWLLSDKNNLKLLWKNRTHAVLYAVKLGESKLTVVSSSSRQPHGYAVMSNILPDSIAFYLKSTNANEASTAAMATKKPHIIISNYEKFEQCIPIQVISNVISLNVTIDHAVPHNDDLDLKDATNIEHPFVCNFKFNSHADEFDNPMEHYIRRNFVTDLKIDLDRLMVACCVKYVGNDSTDEHPTSFENFDIVDWENDTLYSFLMEAHVKNYPKLSTIQTIRFTPRFQLLTKTFLTNTGEIHYFSDASDVYNERINTPVIQVPKDGTIATTQLFNNPSSLPFIKVRSSHPDCFKTQIVSDYYSNRTMLIRIGFNHCQTLKKDERYWVEAKSSLTGQTTRVRIVLSEQISNGTSGSTWFYLRAAFNSLPKVISIDLTTAFFTLLSLVGTVAVVIFVFSGEGTKLSGFANDVRRVAHNASGFLPQAFQSFYRKPAPPPTREPYRKTANGSGTKYNNLLQASYGSNKSNPTMSSKNSSKATVKSAGVMFDNKPNAIYDDDFGKGSDRFFKVYNTSH